MIKAWMMKPQAAGGGLPLTGWTYRKSITLSRASGAVTDYQMKLLVGEQQYVQVTGCESTTGWVARYSSVVSTDAGIEGTNCIKIHGHSDVDANASYQPTSPLDWAKATHLQFQHKRTGAKAVGGVFLFSGSVNTAPYKFYAFDFSDDWTTTTISLASPTSTDGTLNWANITYLRFEIDGNEQDLYIDDIRINNFDVDCGGLCASDFDDIRFTKSDGTTVLDYWIESISGTTPNQLATIWIEFDSIGTGATTFYMYYGNAGAVAYSNITNTFPFGDDFSTAWNSPTKWTGDTGSYSVSSGILSSSGGASKAIKGNVFVSNDVLIRLRANIADQNYDQVGLVDADASEYILVFHHSGVPNHSQWQCQLVSLTGFSNTNAGFGSYHIYELSRVLTGTDTASGKLDNGAAVGSATTNVPTSDLAAWISCGVTLNMSVDWVMMKTYLATEPAWGSWGAQES
jgi:hypothetical protein